nr:hypothetical protein [Enterococcus crotali]
MQELWGRKVLKKEIDNDKIIEVSSQNMPTMEELNDKEIQCLRCGQIQRKVTVRLSNGNYFCPECIQLGRVDTSKNFIIYQSRSR